MLTIKNIDGGTRVFLLAPGAKTTSGPVARDGVVRDDPAWGKCVEIDGRNVYDIGGKTVIFLTAEERDAEADHLCVLASQAREIYDAAKPAREAAQAARDRARENAQIRREIDEINNPH